MTRGRALLVGLAVICCLAGSSGRAQDPSAKDYPNKPIRLVVGFAAGGPTDVIARVIAQDMTIALGQTIVVENRLGANALIATESVARADPDGYTLLFASLSHNVNALLVKAAKYDPLRDFAPISNAAVLPMLIVTSPSTPVSSVAELVAMAKARPGDVTFGSAGNGGSAHLAAAMLQAATGTQMTHVPFRGNGPALNEVIAGRVTFMFYPMIGVADQVAGKNLKVLAVGTEVRNPDFPGVPTTAEAGLKGFEETAPWVGMLAPAGTPAPIVAALHRAMRRSLDRPQTRERMAQLGAIAVGDTPAEFSAFLAKDIGRWQRVIATSGLKPE